MANNDDIQLDLNQDQAGQVIQNVPAGAQTTLAFRVDQSKIPEFWGRKSRIWQEQTTGPTPLPTRMWPMLSMALLGSGSLPRLICLTGQRLSSPGRI